MVDQVEEQPPPPRAPQDAEDRAPISGQTEIRLYCLTARCDQ